MAAARTTGLYPRRLRRGRGDRPDPRRDWDGERAAFTALALVALVFGMQSAIDWTWFVPGPAAMAFVAAGYVAGRGPIAAVGGPEPVLAGTGSAAACLRRPRGRRGADRSRAGSVPRWWRPR